MKQIISIQNRSIANADLRALLEKWIAFLDVKPATAQNYNKGVKRFLLFLDSHQISVPVREDVIAFRSELANHLKPASVALYLTAVKLFFRFLNDLGAFPNIADRIKLPKPDQAFHKKDALDADQCRAVLDAIDSSTLIGKRNRAIIAIMMTAGLRSVEIERANRDDLHSVRGRHFLFVQGKGRDDRSERVELSKTVFRFLKDYLDARNDDSRPLFVSASRRNISARLSSQSVSKLTKAAFRAVGLDSPRLTCHSCRHSCATIALKNGQDLAAVSMVLRHRSIQTTMIYRHDLDRINNQAECSVSESIFGGQA